MKLEAMQYQERTGETIRFPPVSCLLTAPRPCVSSSRRIGGQSAG